MFRELLEKAKKAGVLPASFSDSVAAVGVAVIMAAGTPVIAADSQNKVASSVLKTSTAKRTDVTTGRITQYKPIFKEVLVREDIEKCATIRKQVSGSSEGGGGLVSAAGKIIGAVGGGFLANQHIGGGDGKVLATVGGALLGMMAGDEVTERLSGGGKEIYEEREECRMVPQNVKRNIQTGYEVTVLSPSGQEIKGVLPTLPESGMVELEETVTTKLKG